MRSINKRELFIQSWDLFKGNAQFLINIGVLIFLVQMLIPNLLDGFFNQMSIQYILYRITYLLLVTGVTLGVTAQMIKVTRLMTIESFSDVLNYYHKILTSITGSVLVALAFGVLAVIFIILFMGVSSLSIESIESMAKGDEVSGPLMIGFMGYIVIIAYLSLKTNFFTYFIVDKDMGPIDALRESLTRTTGLEFELFTIYSILALLNLIGALLFGIGLLFTIPYSWMVVSVIYTRYLSD
tara:strand:- start:4912 stop:5631 length:720 start_codon:yes stop_codon:yes gene_type:complete